MSHLRVIRFQVDILFFVANTGFPLFSAASLPVGAVLVFSAPDDWPVTGESGSGSPRLRDGQAICVVGSSSSAIGGIIDETLLVVGLVEVVADGSKPRLVREMGPN